MKTTLRSKLSAMALLTVLLPVIVFSSLHHHEARAEDGLTCEACEEHLPHPGHLGAGHLCVDCPFCQFLAAYFLPAIPESPTLLPSRPGTRYITAVPETVLPVRPHRSTRAPPAQLCLR